MVRHIARRFFLPGGDREDLAQEARWGVTEAMRTWDGTRGVPFSSFAWLCATREARMAVSAATASKHRVLTAAQSLDRTNGSETWDGGSHQVLVALEAERDPDTDPVLKTLARERLGEIIDRARILSSLERTALGMAATDNSYQEIAAALGTRPRAVNNALQRARHKLRDLAHT